MRRETLVMRFENFNSIYEKMKKSVLIIISIILFSNCSENKTKHNEALIFYLAIGKASVKEKESYMKFTSTLNNSFDISKANNPQKLDSVNLAKLENAFQDLIQVYDSDLITLKKLKEFDTEINLKSNFIESVETQRNAIGQLTPKIINLLSNGLESSDQSYEDAVAEFSIATKKQHELKAKIELISGEFMIKYNIKYEEVEKYGL